MWEMKEQNGLTKKLVDHDRFLLLFMVIMDEIMARLVEKIGEEKCKNNEICG